MLRQLPLPETVLGCSVLALLVSGCTTVGNGRSSLFDSRSASRSAYYEEEEPEVEEEVWGAPASSGSAPRVRSRGRVPARSAAARGDTRLADPEAAVSRHEAQLAEMSASQQSVITHADGTVSRFQSDAASLRADIEALKSEVAGLRAENARLKAEQARQGATMDALPEKISKLVAAQMPKAPPPPPPASGSGKKTPSAADLPHYEHTVASGDTVSTIAQAYGVTSADIIRANNLKNANAIRAGQTLIIPAKK